MPSTVTGGPHGMHPISQNWSREHADDARRVGLTNCQSCHGTDYRGTVLSRALGDRSFSTKFGTLALKRGMEVSCYNCHNGPNSSNSSSHPAPAVAAASLAVPSPDGAALTLTASGTGARVRVVNQPLHGSVAISGLVATYLPEPGYAGPDHFTYLATDSGGYRDSVPAVIAVAVGTLLPGADSDGDGLDNFLEYALGLDPYFPSPPGTWGRGRESIGGQHFQTLTLPVGPFPPPNTSVGISVSGDLIEWNPAIPITTGAYQIKARDTVPVESAPRRFIRATATRP